VVVSKTASIPAQAIMYDITNDYLIPKNLIRIPDVAKATASDIAPTWLFK
jgi:hypothetical protein